MSAHSACAVGLLLLAALCQGAQHAAAQGAPWQASSLASQPTPLAPAFTAALPGARGGGFHYYRFSYPGDGSTARVMITFYPSDPAVANGFGLIIFQDGQQVGSLGGSANYCLGAIDTTVSSYSSSPMLVQVYNYVPNMTVSYTLMVVGVYAWPVSTPDNRLAERAFPFPDVSRGPGLVTGSIAGDPGGSFNYFTYTPPDLRRLNLGLTFYPADNVTGNGFGMNLYRAGLLVASANVPYTTAQQTSCGRTFMLTYQPVSLEPLLIQVFNYTPRWTVQYALAQVYAAAPTG